MPGELAAEMTARRGATLGSGAGGGGVQPDGGGPKLGGGAGSEGLGPPTPGRVLSCGKGAAACELETGALGGIRALSGNLTLGGAFRLAELGAYTARASSAGGGVRRGFTLGNRGDDERVWSVESSSPASSCSATGGRKLGGLLLVTGGGGVVLALRCVPKRARNCEASARSSSRSRSRFSARAWASSRCA